MVLATHDFRGHVAWSATGVGAVLGSPDTRDAQVGDAHVPLAVYYQVLRLDVSVDDLLPV